MRRFTLLLLLLTLVICCHAQRSFNPEKLTYTSREWKMIARHCPDEFLKTPLAKQFAENVLIWQRNTGGWPKNLAIHRPLGDHKDAVIADKVKRDDSTTDNDATIVEMTYLARMWHAVPDARYKEAFLKGLRFMLDGQYENGGWPQFWPENRGYQIHITYNDHAMVQTLRIIRDLRDGKKPFDGLVDEKTKKELDRSFKKGIECILNTQIIVNGKRTVWCQQHDRETLAPAPARSYELPSFCSLESAELTRLLMELPSPSQQVKDAVNGAMEWFEKHKITGIRVEVYKMDDGRYDRRVVEDATAAPLWARFYDLKTEEPYFCDRDGIPRKHLSEIGHERRNGYGWYNSAPATLLPLYQKWQEKCQ